MTPVVPWECKNRSHGIQVRAERVKTRVGFAFDSGHFDWATDGWIFGHCSLGTYYNTRAAIDASNSLAS